MQLLHRPESTARHTPPARHVARASVSALSSPRPIILRAHTTPPDPPSSSLSFPLCSCPIFFFFFLPVGISTRGALSSPSPQSTLPRRSGSAARLAQGEGMEFVLIISLPLLILVIVVAILLCICCR